MAELPSIPGYKIIKRLGRGGMATVYLAIQESVKREVALKIMASHLTEDNIWAKRFIHEAQVIAQLSHPSIVPVYDVGTHNGQFFISMEFLSGGSLKDRMTQLLPVPEALKVVAGVAAGLDYAGEKGFVHRDIKPDNIMFREDGSPLILDFGIVKQMNGEASKLTQTGIIVGTTSYMSPEQAQGRELDGRSDIYSLGIMFYELLTGKPPFKGDSDVATLLQHVNDPPPPLPANLRELEPVITRALAKSPEDRYQRAREMIDHLEQLEPAIKAMLARRRTAAPSDATEVKTAISRGLANPQDDDATVVVGHSSTHTQVTTEEELTQVLSSAKATIKDFSAEARERKARRTKNVIMATSIVALSALAYLGYYQFYLVPAERAAAEQKIADAQMKTQKRIEELLNQANRARSNLTPSDIAKTEKVISLYREVLQLDPDNQAAKAALEHLGGRYLALAQQAVSANNIEKAETYREYVQQLIPRNSELKTLASTIKDKRAMLIDDQFKMEKINALLKVAEEDIENTPGFSDSAYTKLQEVLALDESNSNAQLALRNMLDKTFEYTKSLIADGRITRAEEHLTLLERHTDEPERLIPLREQLRQRSSKLAQQQQLTRLLNQASNAERQQRTAAINDDLREIYQEVLSLSPKNSEARRGLAKVADVDANEIRNAIKQKDFERATKNITLLKNYYPKYKELPKLEKSLAQKKIDVETFSNIISTIETRLENDAAPKQRRAELKLALDDYNLASSLDPTNNRLPKILNTLESEYLKTISQLIADNERDLVDDYFEDTQGIAWPTDRLLKLQLSQKKSKPKRVITGGF